MPTYCGKVLKALLRVQEREREREKQGLKISKQTNKKEITFLTVRHCWKSALRILRASSTMRPAMTALVVAMAGMMFPAIARGGSNTPPKYTNT